MAAAAGVLVVAGTVGAALWALANRRADEPAQPDAVPAYEEQIET